MATTQIDWYIVIQLLEERLQNLNPVEGMSAFTAGAGESEVSDASNLTVRFTSLSSQDDPQRVNIDDTHTSMFEAQIEIVQPMKSSEATGSWEPLRIASLVQREFRGAALRDATTKHLVMVHRSAIEYDFGVGDTRSEQLVIARVSLIGRAQRDTGTDIVRV